MTHARPPRWLDDLARRLVGRRLCGLRSATLVITDPAGTHRLGSGGPEIPVRFHDHDVWSRLLFSGHLGACEAYADGSWDTDDLVGLFQAFVGDARTMDRLEGDTARFRVPLAALQLLKRRNRKAQARRNISAHYDLGNSFFAEWLDPTMTYSSGVFTSPGATMEEASREKIDRLCRRLELRPEHHLLEIGTGWGSFAMHAARVYGCRVTTTTISKEQASLARMRIREAGLQDRITLLERDYRDLEGSFDRLVSVEMIEAVGHEHHETFFRRCRDLLTEDGLAALQAITIQDRRYDRARRHEDFIKKHIFPGSCLLSMRRVLEVTGRTTDFDLLRFEDITEDYARTLATWRARFLERRERLTGDGHEEAFLRAWDLYLAYCEAGFRERYLGCTQFVLARPGYRDPSYKTPLARLSSPSEEATS